ncbi:hypothetical protein PHA51_00185 [Rodentibacter pneumotropicus]|uniref:hypothetical protein n=1 Tax=Rodentibacter pneumotropicus TaxID=758 RepID=UPI00233015C0|nr:hypothetical protein [Rodentibacter pneumotropicus]MDC2824454.1 hypothetical protein [Rodentibacter pneumotropicus]
MSKKIYAWLGILLSISLSLFVLDKVYEDALPKIIEEINNGAIGAILTAIVTVFLLQGQTATEEERDKNLTVFEKKQEVYHQFLEKLKDIVEDGKVQIALSKDPVDTIDELKDLLFQLSYIQMHSTEETTQAVFERVTNLIKKMNEFMSAGEEKQKLVANYYASFAEELFGIVAILKNDLYNTSSNPIAKESVETLLSECDLFIEGEKLDKYEMQNYFWNEMQDQLLSQGFKFNKKDFSQDITQYYARSRNRHRWYGIEIPIYKAKNGENITFKLELENWLYYGLIRPRETTENSEFDNRIIELAKLTSSSFNPSIWWFGWKNPDKYHLNFWTLDSGDFTHFKHPQRRARMVKEYSEEIANYIRKFQDIAERQEL